MKTIYLIRHAESGWDNANNDFDRTLTNKGFRDANLISKELDCNPNIIISSPAKRTAQTSLIFAKALNYSIANIDYEMSIYEAPLQNLIDKINLIPSQHQTAILIGHNPGITQLANYLTDDNFSPFTPCSIIKIELEINNWNEIIGGIGTRK